MSVEHLLAKLKTAPESVSFTDCIAVIDANYRFEETAFSNGGTENGVGQNNGSCKILAFARLNGLSEQQTLHCFGDYYRVDVLENPAGDDHQNIRNFIAHGWPGVAFAGEALALK
ncbi:HopJ type III effector protein [Porticoccus sp.]